MKTQLKKSLLGIGLIGAIGGASAQSAAGAIDLYVDKASGQVFTEPGANRVKLGQFVPASAEKPAEEKTPSSAKLEQVEERLKVVEKRTEKADGGGIKIRGYIQARYASIIGGDEGIDLWTDRSVGDSNSLSNNVDNILLRRGRLVFAGDVSDRVSYYIQPDFTSSVGGSGNVFQLRDAYVDMSLNKDKVNRFRVGQSKVPFGFENLQSSQNRIALDRADALNTGVRDERDTGVFYYHTPLWAQALFGEISKAGLKHSGNYGVFAFGVYNGQGPNRRDLNDDLHVVSRYSHPIKLSSGQLMEFGIQGYAGKFVPQRGAFRSTATGASVNVSNPESDVRLREGFDDQRVGVSAVIYPQPFGIQAEWNWGSSPGLDSRTLSIEQQQVHGGYVQIMSMHKVPNYGTLVPFARWQYFDGYNKAELNAPRNQVNDMELGVEWQLNKEFELTAAYHMMDRTNVITGNRLGRADYMPFTSDALRLQLQYNF